MDSAVACPICGEQEHRLFDRGTTRPRDYFSQPGAYAIIHSVITARLPIWRCSACGHGFTPLDCPAEILRDWYASGQEDLRCLRHEAEYRRTAARILRQLQALRAQPGTALDVGCGPGHFLRAARAAGWRVQGVELASWAVARARATLGPDAIREGDVSVLAEMEPTGADVVTLFDVLEHVADPLRLLLDVRRHVRPGGLLVLTLPRFDSLLARLMGRWWHCIFPAHIHHFTRRSLATLLAKAGFAVRLLRSHTRYLPVGYVVGRPLHLVGIPERLTPFASWGWGVPLNLGDEFEVYAERVELPAAGS